jgi:SOS regulatory protein LexA
MRTKRSIESVEKAIAVFFREKRRMPAYAEMIDLFGVKSKSVVHFWINKLIEKGIVEKDETGHLRPSKTAFAIPMVGEVAAGFPSPAEEVLCDIISIDEYLITKPGSSFILKVSGDSMIGEGIKPGDLVIVERGRNPKSGDVVLAEVDSEWTLKYFTRQGAAVVLEAANSKYPPIKPRDELIIAGVVTAVIRKYHL